jgi:hypothetical protein
MIKKVQVYLCILAAVLLASSYKKRYAIDRHLTILKQYIYSTIANTIESPEQGIGIQNAFPDINFQEPTYLKFSNNKGKDYLYVSEKGGKLYCINLTSRKPVKRLIIDISEKTNIQNFNGLLGFEIDTNKKRIYLSYNSNKETIQISAYEGKNKFTKENKLLTINPVYHSGGTLALDSQGFLFISVGDTKRFDSDNSAQDLLRLQGKLLRIIPDTLNPEKYHIPEDNPFINNKAGFREEIFAYGFRNPFRYSIDPYTDEIYLGDVGEDKVEEINKIHKGGNYGWNSYEGNATFKQSENLLTSETIPPLYEYEHGLSGFSVTCGILYKGQKLPFLKESLLYADYVRGAIWALSPKDSANASSKLLVNNAGNITGFSSDAHVEIYYTDFTTGNIMKLVSKNSSK